MKKPVPIISREHRLEMPQRFLKHRVNHPKWKFLLTETMRDAIESGPQHELYWDSWRKIKESAEFTDDNGDKYTIWEHDDLFLIPEGYDTEQLGKSIAMKVKIEFTLQPTEEYYSRSHSEELRRILGDLISIPTIDLDDGFASNIKDETGTVIGFMTMEEELKYD
jgi:hypothetical protein